MGQVIVRGSNSLTHTASSLVCSKPIILLPNENVASQFGLAQLAAIVTIVSIAILKVRTSLRYVFQHRYWKSTRFFFIALASEPTAYGVWHSIDIVESRDSHNGTARFKLNDISCFDFIHSITPFRGPYARSKQHYTAGDIVRLNSGSPDLRVVTLDGGKVSPRTPGRV